MNHQQSRRKEERKMRLSFLEKKKVIKTFTVRHVRPNVYFLRLYKINVPLYNL